MIRALGPISAVICGLAFSAGFVWVIDPGTFYDAPPPSVAAVLNSPACLQDERDDRCTLALYPAIVDYCGILTPADISKCYVRNWKGTYDRKGWLKDRYWAVIRYTDAVAHARYERERCAPPNPQADCAP